MQDDRNMIKKILFGTEKMTRTDNKITLFKIRLNLNASKNLSADQLHALSHIVTFFSRYSSFLAVNSNYGRR